VTVRFVVAYHPGSIGGVPLAGDAKVPEPDSEVFREVAGTRAGWWREFAEVDE